MVFVTIVDHASELTNNIQQRWETFLQHFNILYSNVKYIKFKFELSDRKKK